MFWIGARCAKWPVQVADARRLKKASDALPEEADALGAGKKG